MSTGDGWIKVRSGAYEKGCFRIERKDHHGNSHWGVMWRILKDGVIVSTRGGTLAMAKQDVDAGNHDK